MQNVREHLLVMEVEFDVDLVQFGDIRTIWEQNRNPWVWNPMVCVFVCFVSIT